MPTIVYQNATPNYPHSPTGPPRAESPENAHKTPPNAARPCPYQNKIPADRCQGKTKRRLKQNTSLPANYLGTLLPSSSSSSSTTLRPRTPNPTRNPLPLLPLPTTRTSTSRRPNPQPLPRRLPPRTPPHPALAPPTSTSPSPSTTARSTSSGSSSGNNNPPRRHRCASDSPCPSPPSSCASQASVSCRRGGDFDEGLVGEGYA